jgi:hypothetical protein
MPPDDFGQTNPTNAARRFWPNEPNEAARRDFGRMNEPNQCRTAILAERTQGMPPDDFGQTNPTNAVRRFAQTRPPREKSKRQ